MKNSRVSVIKNNIKKQTPLPTIFKNDCDVGQWADNEMIKKGHKFDTNGTVDMPDYKIDQKTRKKGSNANYTVGSMTIPNILNTPRWEDTGYFPKVQNQNQITWDPDFNEVSNVTILDMDVPDIQEKLKEAYEDLRSQLEENVKDDVHYKEIKSSNGWAVFDGYSHPNSYKYRITNKAMKKIKTISATYQSLKRNFDF